MRGTAATPPFGVFYSRETFRDNTSTLKGSLCIRPFICAIIQVYTKTGKVLHPILSLETFLLGTNRLFKLNIGFSHSLQLSLYDANAFNKSGLVPDKPTL
jgi:hypothetical protein